jgi:hypothetical protein
MGLLLFSAGFFIGGFVGTILMAALSIAGHARYSRPIEQNREGYSSIKKLHSQG